MGVKPLLLALPSHLILNHTMGEARDLLGVLEKPPHHTELLVALPLPSVYRPCPMSQSIFTS